MDARSSTSSATASSESFFAAKLSSVASNLASAVTVRWEICLESIASMRAFVVTINLLKLASACSMSRLCRRWSVSTTELTTVVTVDGALGM